MNFEFPIIIDGGLSNELEKQGCNLQHKLWTAHLLDQNDDALRNVHLNYMRAGAQCVASASYQASIKGLTEGGYSHDQARMLLQKSINLVAEARDTYYSENPKHQKVYIVASIGPYGAYTADGAEYRGNYNLTKLELSKFHQERLQIFEESKADILAFETIPDKAEAEVIAQMTQNSAKPCWISFSCKDDSRISDGTPLSEIGNIFKDHPAVFAVGANCVRPELIPGIIKSLNGSIGDKEIIVYPNSGGFYDSTDKHWYANQGKFSLKNHVDRWISLGANIIGGCCKIGADEIGELVQHLNRECN